MIIIISFYFLALWALYQYSVLPSIDVNIGVEKDRVILIPQQFNIPF